MTLKAAVIGVGSMGKNHARVYNELDNVELVAVSDIDKALSDKVASKYKVNSYIDYNELLEKEKPDLVSIVVPTSLHHKVALDVINHGINLLVEKPIASTAEEAEEIIQKASEKKVKLCIGHIERFNPAILELKKRLDAGALGRIYSIQINRVGPFPTRIRDVGVVLDLAVHDLDMMRFLTGSEPKRIYAETERRIHTEHEDILNGFVKFESKTLGVLNINWLTPTKIRELRVTGEKGMFVANQLTQDLYFYESTEKINNNMSYTDMMMGVSEGNMTTLKINKKEPLVAELSAFAASVQNNSDVPVSGEDGLKALELAKLLIESANKKTSLKTGK